MSWPRCRKLFVAISISVLVVVSVTPRVPGQSQVSRSLPFERTEQLVFEAVFSRSLLRGASIGDVRLSATVAPPPRSINVSSVNGPVDEYQFSLDAVSKGLFPKLFGIRIHDHIDSRVDAATFAVRRSSKVDEQGSRRRDSEAVFDASSCSMTWTEHDPNDPSRPARVITSPFSGTVQDLASAFYFLRLQPLEPGRTFQVPLWDSGRIYPIPVTVVEKKKMKTVIGEVQTVRVDPEIFGEGRLLRGKGEAAIWLTDDARRLPVRIRIAGEQGTVEFKLKSLSSSR